VVCGREGRRAYGRSDSAEAGGKRNLVIKTPIGVVGAISPGTFPLMLARARWRRRWPPVALWCSSRRARLRLSCIAFAECVHAAELPKGVVQVVCGQSNEIGQEFSATRSAGMVTFTGSTEVGRVLIRGAAETIKPLSLSCGNAPLLVFDRCGLKVASRARYWPRCAIRPVLYRSNRFLVQRTIYEPVPRSLRGPGQSLESGRVLGAGDGDRAAD